MNYRSLGATNLRVSELGFGCGSVGGLMVRGGAEEQREVVGRALEAGVTYFDTAPSYGAGRSEENLGRTLGELGAWDRVNLGTKVTVSAADLADPVTAVRTSLQASLRRLGRDAIDLLQLHSRVLQDQPTGDGGLPAAEVRGIVAEAMRQMVREGLVRHIGLTGLGETEGVIQAVSSRRFDTVQAYFNALNPSAGFPGASGGAQDFQGLIDTAAAAGMGVIAIRVAAAGALSGTSERADHASPAGGGALAAGGDFQSDLGRAQALASIAEDLGLENTVELGLRFALAKPGVSTVLVGFSNLAQLNDALRWTDRGALAASAIERVVRAAAGQSL